MKLIETIGNLAVICATKKGIRLHMDSDRNELTVAYGDLLDTQYETANVFDGDEIKRMIGVLVNLRG